MRTVLSALALTLVASGTLYGGLKVLSVRASQLAAHRPLSFAQAASQNTARIATIGRNVPSTGLQIPSGHFATTSWNDKSVETFTIPSRPMISNFHVTGENVSGAGL